MTQSYCEDERDRLLPTPPVLRVAGPRLSPAEGRFLERLTADSTPGSPEEGGISQHPLPRREESLSKNIIRMRAFKFNH